MINPMRGEEPSMRARIADHQTASQAMQATLTDTNQEALK